MSILVSNIRGTVTPVLGSVQKNIQSGAGLCYQIFIKADTSTTTFDVSLTDVFGNVTYVVQNITGQLNSLNVIPCYGNWTLSIDNASVDEEFTYCFIFRDR